MTSDHWLWDMRMICMDLIWSIAVELPLLACLSCCTQELLSLSRVSLIHPGTCSTYQLHDRLSLTGIQGVDLIGR